MEKRRKNDVDQLIKTATHYWLNKYQHNDDIYHDFVLALQKIIYQYQPTLRLDPFYIFEIHFMNEGVAILWVNTYDDKNAYQTYTDMSLLAEQIKQLIIKDDLDFKGFALSEKTPTSHFQGYNLSKNISIAIEDFDSLVNGHIPDLYKDECINAELMNEFLMCIRDLFYQKSD